MATPTRIKGFDHVAGTHDEVGIKLGNNLKFNGKTLDTVLDLLPDVNTEATTTVAKGDAVYMSAADEVSIADASVIATGRVAGLAFAAAGPASPAVIQTAGRIDGVGSGWTAGLPVYLTITGTTGNTLSQTPPVADNEVQIEVGVALNATDLDIRIGRPLEL